jgi:hypothetical protein
VPLDKIYKDSFSHLLSLQEEYVAVTPGAIRTSLIDQIEETHSGLKVAFDNLFEL